MKKNKLKKVLICLFSFLFIASATVASGVLLSGSSYSVPTSEGSVEDIQDGENFESYDNNATSNATEPTNDDSWANHYADSFARGSGSPSAPYQIETAEQLSLLAVNVNSGTNYSDIYFEQTADIDLSAYWWDAIGTYTSSSDYNEFAGHFNGGGHTVSGVFTQAGSTSTYNYQGLFGYVRGTSSTDLAEISNVGVIDSNIQGYQNVGGIVGYAWNTNITNCYNTSSVTGSYYVGGVVGYSGSSSTVSNSYNTGSVTGEKYYVGGVVGSNSSATVENSYNTGSVIGSGSNVGGVVGFNNSSATVSNSYNTGSVTGSSSNVGGVVGSNINSTVTNSYNTGSVTGSSNCVGGVVGYNYSSSTVSNSYNTGNVTSTYTGTEVYLGGVVGRNYSSSTVENSYNTGSVTGDGQNVGGVVGSNNNSSTVSNSYNTATVTSSSYYVGGVVGYSSSSTVSNSYNTGTVTGSSLNVGGVVGYNYSSTVSYCYYGGGCDSTVGGINGADVDGQAEYIGTITTDAKTESWYGSSSTVIWNSSYPWDFTDTWGITQYANDGYPYLLGVGNIAPDNTDLMWTDDGVTRDTDFEGSGTASDPYLISSAEELAGLAYNVNNGTNYSGTYFKQTADIDVSAYWWDAIGTYSSSSDYNEFAGNYDGGSHTVSGVFTQAGSSSTYSYQGLFGYVRGTSSTNRAEISNVGVIDSNIQGYQFVGGIVGRADYTNITNCYNTGSVTGTSFIGGVVGYNYSSTVSNSYNAGTVTGSSQYVGGVVGQNFSSSTVSNSYNTGDVTGNQNVGGVVGYSVLSSTVSNSYNIGSVTGRSGFNVGGVVGSNSSSTVSNSYNTGSVTGTSYVGGVVGENYLSTVSNSYNTGNVTSTYTGTYAYTGGVVGYNSSATVENSYNIGSVTASSQRVGGITGYNYGSSARVNNTYNTGTVSGTSYVAGVVGDNSSSSTVSNSYNTGSVTGRNNYVGGVVGYNDSSTVSNSYNTGDVTGNLDVGGVVGLNLSSTVTNSYNTGTVTGSSLYVGGVVGFNSSSTVTNSYNTGDVTSSTTASNSCVGGVVGYSGSSSTVSNSYNTGSVTSSGGEVGGVVGDNSSSSTVSYCYYGGGCPSSVGGIDGADVDGQAEYWDTIATDAKTESWYGSSSTVTWNSSYLWDFTYVWALDSSVNDGYPHFKEITVTYHSNYGDDFTISKSYLATYVVFESDIITRPNYEVVSWNTNQTGTGTSYTPGETYQIATDINLYAQWRGVLYNITLNHGNGNTNTTIYQRYATGFYSNSGATTEITSITSFMSLPTMNGYSFGGYYAGENGEGYQVIDEEGNIVVSNTFFTADTTVYAYWEANVPAYYDETGGYWYIEYGKMPQTKLDSTVETDRIIINALDGDSVLDDTDGVTTSSVVYYFAGNMYSAKIYNGEEYCNVFGNWYRVEPVRWVLDTDASSSQSGYVSTDTLAVMESVVYIGRYSNSSLGLGDGYETGNDFSFIDYYYNNFLPNEREYLVEFSAESETFNSNALPTVATSTNNIFLSSSEEIESVIGTYSTEFSDLVKDYLKMTDEGNYYFVRDLGSNLNSVTCYTQGGGEVNQTPTSYLGMRFTIQVTEYIHIN